MKKQIEKHSIWLSLLLVLGVMGMIFWFSAQTGSQSGAMSGKITDWLIHIFQSEFDSISPEEKESLYYTVGLIIRKLGHFSEYALLGFSLMLHIHTLRRKIRVRLPILWAWAVGTLYAASDEFHQGFVADRGPSVFDVMIDSAGVITGVVLTAWILRRVLQNAENPAIIKKNTQKDENI